MKPLAGGTRTLVFAAGSNEAARISAALERFLLLPAEGYQFSG
jgi:hypothetical protein